MTLEQKLFITLNLEFDNILLIRDLQFPSMQKTIPKKKEYNLNNQHIFLEITGT